jgi:hypothetical protein
MSEKHLCPFKPIQHYNYTMAHDLNERAVAPQLITKTIETKFSTCVESCVAYAGAREGQPICRRMSST